MFKSLFLYEEMDIKTNSNSLYLKRGTIFSSSVCWRGIFNKENNSMRGNFK
jgi:hypothetical protein